MRIEQNGAFSLRLTCSWISGTIDNKFTIALDQTDTGNRKCSKADRAEEERVTSILVDNEWQQTGDQGVELTRGQSSLSFRPLRRKLGPDRNVEAILGEYIIVGLNGEAVASIGERPPTLSLTSYRIDMFSGCNEGSAEIDWTGSMFNATSSFVHTQMGCGTLTNQEARLFGITGKAEVVVTVDGLELRGEQDWLLARKR